MFDDEDKCDCLKLDKYSLKYLLLIGKATNLSNVVQIFLKEDEPIFLSYRVGTIGKATFALAPQEDVAKECKIPYDVCGGKMAPSIKPKSATLKRPVRRKRKNASISFEVKKSKAK